jgi:hypothetical protein
MPSTLSQPLPRDSMAKCAKSVGDFFFAGRRDFFFGLFLLYQAPRGCRFEPVLTESGYVHRSEDVGYRVQYGLLVWTNRQNIRTPEQFSSTAKDIYSSGLMLHIFERSNYGKTRG